jgi:hypothetical protein
MSTTSPSLTGTDCRVTAIRPSPGMEVLWPLFPAKMKEAANGVMFCRSSQRTLSLFANPTDRNCREAVVKSYGWVDTGVHGSSVCEQKVRLMVQDLSSKQRAVSLLHVVAPVLSFSRMGWL